MSAPAKWGKEPAEFIHELEGKQILVTMTNGKAFKGQLVGADPYNLVIRQESGLELMINKGQLLYLHAAGAGE